MYFVGIVSNHIKLDLNKYIQNNENKNNIQLININKRSIENIKNIKFDTIVILDSLEKFSDNKDALKDICIDIQYLLLNSDIEINANILPDIKANIITFGLNHKSTVTFSSITNETFLVSIQRRFVNKENSVIEVGEYSIKPDIIDRTYLHEILIRFILNIIYKK